MNAPLSEARPAGNGPRLARVLPAVLVAATVAACLTAALVGTSEPARADDWPQWGGPQRDAVLREEGLIETFPAAGPKVVWRAKVGLGYSGPAIVGDSVYITDRILAAGAANPDNPFATSKKGALPKTGIPGQERVLCLDAKTGAVRWTHAYDCGYTISYAAGPRCTPIVRDGKVWTLGAEGHLFCLSAKDGTVVWKKDFRADYDTEPPVWGHSASPILDGNRLITLVGGDNSAVVAFDADTGKELWKALKTPDVG